MSARLTPRCRRFAAVLLVCCFPTGMALGQSPRLPDCPSASQRFARAKVNAAAVLTYAPARPEGQETAPSQAPAASHDAGGRGLLRRGLEDQKEIYTLPLHRRNLKWTALFLAGTAGLIAADKHVSGEIGTAHTDVSRTISDVGLYSMIGSAGLIGLEGLAHDDTHAKETAFLAGESFVNSGIVYLGTQLITGRQRPLEGTRQGDFWKNNALDSSFPSGHATFSWTLASVIAHEYPSPWVQILTYGTATTVSVTRVTGLKHFPADVAVGAVFGYFIGQHIFHSHCRAGLSASCHEGKEKP